MSARTHRLAIARATVFNAYETVYTVPAGHTTIIRSCTIYPRNSVAADIFWAVLKNGDSTTRNLARFNVTTGQWQALQPYWVLAAGDALRIFYGAATGGLPDYFVFGPELTA